MSDWLGNLIAVFGVIYVVSSGIDRAADRICARLDKILNQIERDRPKQLFDDSSY